MTRQSSILLLLVLIALAACAPVPIPTGGQATALPPPGSSPSAVPPTDTVAPPSVPPPVPISTSSPSAPPSPTVPSGPMPEGGSITVGAVIGADWDINGLPPFLQTAVFDSLLRANPKTGALEPGLAEYSEVSKDGLTITFRLRQGLRWHNGDPVTSADVVASIEAFSDPEYRGVAVTDFGTFTKATAVDDRTVRLTMRDTYCPALTNIGMLKIVPKAIANSTNFPRLKPEQLVGTGPLKVQSVTGDQITFSPNRDYYLGAPHIDNWTLRLYPNSAALQSAFASKQVEVIDGSSSDYGRLKKLQAPIVASNAPEVVMLVFNTDTIPLDDAYVRQGLAYALDREVLQSDIGGQGELAPGSTLPGYWGNPVGLAGFTFDLGRAKEMLANAGWRQTDGVMRKDNRQMSLELWTEADDPVLEPLAFRIRETYAALGIQVKLQLDDRAGWVTRAFSHRFDLLLVSRKIPLDPDQRWYWQSDQDAKGSGFNFGSYSSGRVDALLKQETGVAGCSAEDRGKVFADIQRNLLIESPAVFLIIPKQYLAGRNLLNAAPSPFAGIYWDLKDWRVKGN